MARPGTLCYIRKGGKTLMVYRNKKEVDLHKGLYVAPGGKIEPEDESSLERTMLRETEQETGLTPKDYDIKGFLTFSNDERVFSDSTTARTWGKSWDVAVYVAKDYSGELLEEGPEGDLVWVPDEQVARLPMHQGDRIFTPWLKAKEYFIATFQYGQDRVERLEKEFFEDKESFMEAAKERYQGLTF